MLTLTNISKLFSNTKVLKKISCSIERGDFIVIVGTNGSGKTTLFDIIAGSLMPDEGTISYQNLNITNQNERMRAAWISRLYQNTNTNCVPEMTVAQNFALALLKGARAQLALALNSKKRVEIIETLRRFKLDAYIDTPMGDLSGGQRQLIAFIMATITHPQLLLLDEPTAALDPIAATTLLKTVASYNQEHGLTTLLITHDPHLAIALGNKIWVLENGMITKKLEGAEKKDLAPEDLIGHIDYQTLLND